jgi:hypothetical protein
MRLTAGEGVRRQTPSTGSLAESAALWIGLLSVFVLDQALVRRPSVSHRHVGDA